MQFTQNLHKTQFGNATSWWLTINNLAESNQVNIMQSYRDILHCFIWLHRTKPTNSWLGTWHQQQNQYCLLKEENNICHFVWILSYQHLEYCCTIRSLSISPKSVFYSYLQKKKLFERAFALICMLPLKKDVMYLIHDLIFMFDTSMVVRNNNAVPKTMV